MLPNNTNDILKLNENATLFEKIKSTSTDMRNHRVFGLILTVNDLQKFMQWHVFPVWDFMSLVKRLQLEFTSVTLPWTPPRNIETAHLINEIVLGEETDISPDGKRLSHFQLYLKAMEEIGANTQPVRNFVDLVAGKMSVQNALLTIDAPTAVKRFVQSTIDVATTGSVEEVLGSFVYGREDAIPEMFQSLLKTWKIDESSAPTFVFYLQRHIALDADEHGPAAMQMLADQVAGDSDRLETVLLSALKAIQERINLWEALACEFERDAVSMNRCGNELTQGSSHLGEYSIHLQVASSKQYETQH